MVVSLSLGLVILSPWPTARGQSAPKIDSLSLTWFQRGTTNEITLSGAGFQAGSTLHLTGLGITGSLVLPATHQITLEASGGGLIAAPALPSTQSAQARLIVSASAPLGAQELRLVSPNGVSNGQKIQVSDVLEVVEQESNDTLAKAQTLALPCAISGVIGRATEADYFKFHGRPGENLSFDVQANRTGSPLDPTLLLLDAMGKELARSDDVHGLDPFLEFTPILEADYFLKLSDLRFQGGADYRYRLVAGVLPYLETLFPFGGRRGTTVEVRFTGKNLEGVHQMSLNLAADAPLGRQDLRAVTPIGHSNPLPFEASDLPDANETEPNDTQEQANALVIPMAINGLIGTPKDTDTFRFKVERDQKLVIEVHARRFGSPLDVLLTLTDSKGAVLQQNDDSASGPDARIEAEFKVGQEYFVTLRDLTDRGGESFGYRLTLQPPTVTPNFTVKASVGRLRLHAGGHTPVRVEVERRNGLDGIVTVRADRLPLGISANTVVLDPKGANFGWLVLSPDDDVPLGSFPLHLTASAEQNGATLKQDVVLPELGFLTVLPAAPFGLLIADSAGQVEQNASLSLDVAVLRRTEFAGEIKVIAEEFAGMGQPSVTIPSGQARAKLVLNAAYNSAVGTRPLMVRAEATNHGILIVDYAALPIPLTTQGIPVFLTAMLPGSSFFRTDPVKLSAVALPAGAKSEANQTEFVVKSDRRGLTNQIPLILEDLPPGVLATVVPIPESANEATIKLVVSDQAEKGKEYPLIVVGSITNRDRIYHPRTQPVILTVLAPEKETAAVATPTNPVTSPALSPTSK